MEVYTSYEDPSFPENCIKEENTERIYLSLGAIIFKNPEETWNSLGVDSDIETLGEHGAKFITYQNVNPKNKIG